jgi:predicted RNase H-like nuclease (RuvC/YqgF family)
MTVDLQNAEARKTYLSAKLDDLMDGISDSYGTVLMDELITRLERTVSEFNEEMGSLMAGLKENSERRDELMEKIKSGIVDKPVQASAMKEKEMSAWEKRLEALDKK